MDCKKNEVLELKMAIQPHLCCSVYCNGYDAPNGDDIGDFACNICLDLAHDPIVTLCGHLFCWPCLYEWLQYYSRCYECPVCKAVVDEEKLVPLYGRGKKSTDPRMKVVPRRPVGCRPETAVYGNAGGHQLTGGMEFEI